MAVPLASSLQLHCSGSGLRDKQSTTTAAKARPSTSRAHCTTETTFVSLLTKPTRAERSTAVSARDSANIIKQISSSWIFRKQTQTKKTQEGTVRQCACKTTARGNVHSLRATCGHKAMDGVQIRASLYLSNLIVRAISSCNPSRHCQKEEVRKTERGMDQCKSSYLLLSASSHDGVQIRASIYLSNLAVRSPKSGDEETRAEKRRTGMNPQQTESSAACKNDDRALCERSRFAP